MVASLLEPYTLPFPSLVSSKEHQVRKREKGTRVVVSTTILEPSPSIHVLSTGTQHMPRRWHLMNPLTSVVSLCWILSLVTLTRRETGSIMRKGIDEDREGAESKGKITLWPDNSGWRLQNEQNYCHWAMNWLLWRQGPSPTRSQLPSSKRLWCVRKSIKWP